jgi:hypothetical protein
VNVDIAVVSAKHQMSICVMVTLVILTIYMEMTMSKYYIVSVAKTIAADSEEQALEDAKQEFIEMLQREEADWSVEEYEDE